MKEMIAGGFYGEEADGFVEEIPLMEGRFYFQNEALGIEAEGASDLVLHPINGLPTSAFGVLSGRSSIVGHYRGFDGGSTGPGKLRATPSGPLNRSELQKCGRTSIKWAGDSL